MTGLVQTSSEAKRSWSSSPLIVSRDSFSHQTWALFGYHYIYFCYIIFITYALRVSILWPLRFGWMLVCCLNKEVYLQIFKRVFYWLHGCCGVGKVWSVNQVNHTGWVAICTPTDRPKSVRNRCVMEPFLWHCLCCHFALLSFLLV